MNGCIKDLRVHTGKKLLTSSQLIKINEVYFPIRLKTNQPLTNRQSRWELFVILIIVQNDSVLFICWKIFYQQSSD